MEIILDQTLKAKFSGNKNEKKLDFTMSSSVATLNKAKLYFHSETELDTDEDSKQNLIYLIVRKYIENVNTV